MATNTIKLKKSSVPGKVPTDSDLEYGEVALNFADGRLYYKTSTNQIDFFRSDSGGAGSIDSAQVNDLVDAKIQVLDIADIVGSTGNPGEYLKSLGNGNAEWASIAADSAFVLNNSLDSAEVVSLIDSAYVQLRQSGGLDSAGVRTLLADSSFTIDGDGTNGGVIISDGSVEIKTSTGSPAFADFYCEVGNIHRTRVKSAPHAQYSGNVDVTLPVTTGTLALTSDITLDSAAAISLIDSAYINSRVSTGTDSSTVITLVQSTVDSAYVQARQDFAYSSLTGAPNVLDSANVTALIGSYDTFDSAGIISLIDSSYVQARQTPQDFAYSSLTGAPNVLDSADVTGLIDSAYVQARQDFSYSSLVGAPNVLDSADVASISGSLSGLDSTGVRNLVDSAYVQLRQDYAYSSLTGVPTLLDSSTAIALIDSAYVQARQITYSNLSEFTNDTNYLDSTTVTGVIDATYIQANQTTYDFLDSSETIALIDSAYVQARQITYTVLDSDDVTGLIDSAYINARVDLSAGTDSATVISLVQANSVDSAEVLSLIDSAYVAARVGNITGIDSASVIALIDSAYVQARITSNVDEALITSTVDSAYVTSRIDSSALSNFIDTLVATSTTKSFFRYSADSGQTAFSGNDISGDALSYNPNNVSVYINGLLLADSDDYVATNGTSITLYEGTDLGDDIFIVSQATDLTEITTLIDSAYVNARLGTAIDSATTISLINANSLDSAEVISLIDSAYIAARTTAGTDSAAIINLIDSAYVQARQDFAYSSLTGTPTVLDSALTTQLIDSAHVQARQDFAYSSLTGAPTILDSALTIQLIDSAHVQARQDYSYASLTGTPTILDSALISQFIDSAYVALRSPASGLDSALAIQLIDSAYVQLRETPQDFSYSSLTGAPNVLDSADVAVIAGSISGLDSTGVRTLVDSAYVQLRQDYAYSSLTGAPTTFDSNSNAVFSTLTTTGNVVVGGDLQVTGTTTTISTQNLEVTDNMIYLNAGESAGSPTASIDIGFAGNYNEGGSYAHAGLFRDATDQTWKFFDGYTPEPDSSVQINTGDGSFNLAPLQAGPITGTTLTGIYQGFDSDFTTKSTTDLSEGTNLYYTSTRVDSDILALVDSAYVALRAPAGGTDSATVLSLISANSLDSAEVISLIDSAYVQARQDFAYSSLTGSPFILDSNNVISLITSNSLDSSEITNLIDSAYVAARTSAGTDSSTVITLINANSVDSSGVIGIVDSDYITSKIDISTTKTLYRFSTDSGQTSFSGNDLSGDTLSYDANNVQIYLNGLLLADSDDYAATDGTTITLYDGTDSGDDLFVVTYSNLVSHPWKAVSSATYSATAGQRLMVDTTSSAVTVTLPSAAAFGDEIQIVDGGGNAGTNNITINRNGSNIRGTADNLTMDYNDANVTLVYYNASRGWIITAS